MLAMGTAHVVKDILPQLHLDSIRAKSGVIKKSIPGFVRGTTFPMLYNDDVNIPSVQKAFDVHFRMPLIICLMVAENTCSITKV